MFEVFTICVCTLSNKQNFAVLFGNVLSNLAALSSMTQAGKFGTYFAAHNGVKSVRDLRHVHAEVSDLVRHFRCSGLPIEEIVMTKAAVKPVSKHVIDAISLLTEDHRKVKKLFAEFAKLAKANASNTAKADLVHQICSALTMHAQAEEEIFYPAVRAAIKDMDLMDEADVEHAEAKSLIAQLKAMKPTDDHYNAKVTVLGENIAHHVREEEGEMFPKAMKAKLDMNALGEALAYRKAELEAAMDKGSEVKAKKMPSH